MDIRIISYEHPLYTQVLDLRQRILRTPIGLNIQDEDLEPEKEQITFIAEQEGVVLGCVMLQHYDAHIFKLRQMAVDTACQGKGIGAALLQAAGVYAINMGKQGIVMHARIEAVPFYERSGYVVSSALFTEVGIPHVKMTRNFLPVSPEAPVGPPHS